MDQQSESKARQVADAAAGELVSQPFELAFEIAIRALGDGLSCAADVAVHCGSAAAEVACGVAGAALDGI